MHSRPARSGGRREPDIPGKNLIYRANRTEGLQADALVFSSPAGMPMRHSNFYRRVRLPAVAKAGLSGVHFHDLRHTGNTTPTS